MLLQQIVAIAYWGWWRDGTKIVEQKWGTYRDFM